MHIGNIRKRVNQIFSDHYRLLLPAFYLINCVTLLAQLSSSGAIAFIIEMALVTLSHGFIHISLMMVHEDVDHLRLKDIFIGVFQFPKYFPAYIIRKVILVGTLMLCMVPVIYSIYHMAGSQFYEVLDALIYLLFSNALRIDAILDFIQHYTNITTIIFLVIGVLVNLYLSVLFILVPCIVEDYDYAWNEALSKSVRMMNGHIKEFIQLWVTFIPSYFVYLWISVFMLSFCQFIPVIGYSLYLVASMLAKIGCYQVRFYQAVALFYVELRDQTQDSRELFRI